MNKELLKKYFEGKCNLDEKRELYQYFKGRDMEAFDEYLKEQYSDPAVPYSDPAYRDGFYNEMQQHVRERELAKTTRRRLNVTLRIAASIALVLSIGGLIWLGMKKNTETPVPMYKAYHNNTGRLRKIILRDGTQVWLNPGTTVSYDNTQFTQTSRDVRISGEAYFDVARNVTIPFRVCTGDMTTTVVGTAFNVEAYDREQTMRLTLVRGLVDVLTGSKVNKLTAGQMLSFNKNNKIADISQFDLPEKSGLFTSGKIVLEDVPLGDVMDRLEIAFEIEIICPDKNILKNKTITGSYKRDNAEATLKRILFIHGLKYRKKGDNTYMVYD